MSRTVEDFDEVREISIVFNPPTVTILSVSGIRDVDTGEVYGATRRRVAYGLDEKAHPALAPEQAVKQEQDLKDAAVTKIKELLGDELGIKVMEIASGR